jgi:predicted nucleic acid-binding Zn ribbon protein
MKMQAPRRVADLVASALPQLTGRLLEGRIRRQWLPLVGPEMARRTQPGRLENGCLTITVDNSPWMQELSLRQPDLTARLAKQVPEVRSLRFAMGTVTREVLAPRVSRPRTDALGTHDLREIDEAVSSIGDSDVASAARRLLTTARRFSRSRGTA